MFIRRSLYKHITIKESHRDLVYDGIKPSESSWDSNKLSASNKYLALIWNTTGGGAFLYHPIESHGRILKPSLISGHSAVINDINFDPHSNSRVATASDDGTAKIWDLETEECLTTFLGHSKRVGGVIYHPSADNVLASFSNDYSIKIWNGKTGDEMASYELEGVPTYAAWSLDGSVLAVVDKTKKLTLFKGNNLELIRSFQPHTSPRNVRIAWMSNDTFITTGFSTTQERQFIAWSANDTDPLWSGIVDSSSSILIPFYEVNQKILYLFSKGASDVNVYEIVDKKPFYYKIGTFMPVQHQLIAIASSNVLDYENSEIAKFFVASKTKIETFTVAVPRKQPGFNADFYPLGKEVGVPAISLSEFLEGSTATALRTDCLNEEHVELVEEEVIKEDGVEVPTSEPLEVVKEISENRDIDSIIEENRLLKSRIEELEAKLAALEALQ